MCVSSAQNVSNYWLRTNDCKGKGKCRWVFSHWQVMARFFWLIKQESTADPKIQVPAAFLQLCGSCLHCDTTTGTPWGGTQLTDTESEADWWVSSYQKPAGARQNMQFIKQPRMIFWVPKPLQVQGILISRRVWVRRNPVVWQSRRKQGWRSPGRAVLHGQCLEVQTVSMCLWTALWEKFCCKF